MLSLIGVICVVHCEETLVRSAPKQSTGAKATIRHDASGTGASGLSVAKEVGYS